MAFSWKVMFLLCRKKQLMKGNEGRCKESTLRGHRKNLRSRWDSNPRPFVLWPQWPLLANEFSVAQRLEHPIQNTEDGNPTWGSDFFCVLLWSILYISRYFLYNTNISGIGWLVRGSFTTKIELEIPKKLSKFYLIQPWQRSLFCCIKS